MKQNVCWIQNIDSNIFTDTQCIIQKVTNNNTNMKVLKTKEITSPKGKLEFGFFSVPALKLHIPI